MSRGGDGQEGGGLSAEALARRLGELVDEGARVLGVRLPERAVEGLARYGVLLVEAGRRAGFRAPDALRVLAGKHLVDSLTCLLATDFEAGKTVLDVGSGVGLPGLVVAICRPGSQVVLLEARARRAGFLRWAVWRLGLENAEVWRGRAEEVRATGHVFDRVLARALAAFPRAAELCLPLLAPGGEFVAMLGPRGEEELERAEPEVAGAGSRVTRVMGLDLPWGAGRRVLVVVARREERAGIVGN